MKRLAALFLFFRPYRKNLVAGVICICLSVVIGLAAPILVGRAVDAFREEIDGSALLRYAALLVGITLVQGVFGFGQRLILVSMSRHIEFDLRNGYFRHLERQPLSFFHRNYTGDLMARGTNDLQAIRMLCGPAIMYSWNTVFTAAGALFLMSRIHLQLTLLALCTMPLVAVATKVFGQRIHLLFERVQEQFSTLSTRVQESLAGVRVVRAYAQEVNETSRFSEVNREYVERNRRLIRWTSAFHPLLHALVGVGFVAVLWYGGLLASRGQITVGQFVTFNLFLGKMIWPMIAIGWVINLVQRGTASLGRVQHVLETEPEIRDAQELVHARGPLGSIEFRDLTFRYEADGAAVLSEIDLEVPVGETLAVVGRTGSGKSTLLSLMPRLIDPPPDKLLMGGADVREMPLAELRAAIAVVPQETFLFSATVAENIAVGQPEASRTELLDAARLAGLEADLEQFPLGLDTLVGERGVTLSGGQKQRVALARALIRRPQVLLLDDCLSAVDTGTEETILQNLRGVFGGRTVVLVSHRVSTVRHAGMIIVLDAGRIVERGDHDRLVALNGIYADLYRRQLLEEELAAV